MNTDEENDLKTLGLLPFCQYPCQSVFIRGKNLVRKQYLDG